jgi:hypothetical protein
MERNEEEWDSSSSMSQTFMWRKASLKLSPSYLHI